MSLVKPLHLKVEWNGKSQWGQQLSPKFTMMGTDLRKLELVSCKLDERLHSAHWRENPTERVCKENQCWTFMEPLSLECPENSASGGDFYIEFFAQFQIVQDDQLVTIRYKKNIPLHIEGTGPEKNRKITVEAKDGGLVRLKNDVSDASIHIIADGDACVDLSPSLLSPLNPPIKNEPALKNTYETDVEPYFEQPFSSSGINPLLCLYAKLQDGQERFFQIVARSEAILGRSRSEHPENGVRAADFIYRFYRTIEENTDPVALFLSKLISRNNLRLALSENGLELENLGNEVDFILKNRQDVLYKYAPETIRLNDLEEPLHLNFYRFSSIELEKFKTLPNWEREVIKILRENHYDCEGLRNSLWNLGTSTGVNSLRLKRTRQHPANPDLRKQMQEAAARKYPESSSKSPLWTQDLMANEEEYHLLTRMLTIGSNPKTDAIYFNRQKLEEHHATLFYCENHFGLINHSHTAIPYRKYGENRKLFQNDVLPLQPGISFQIGDVEFHIYENYSNFLEILKQKRE